MHKIWFAVLGFFLFATPAFAALKIDDAAPAFTLPAFGKKEYSFSGAQTGGNGGTIISFFASWCMPCRTELPMLNALVPELGAKGIKVLLVGVREDFGTIGQLLTELKVDKPVVVSDRDGKVSEQYRVLFLPTTFFVGGDGRVKDIIFGQIKDEAQVRKGIASITTP
jgi:thiol-disulfide isomerase/thioredoxin